MLYKERTLKTNLRGSQSGGKGFHRKPICSRITVFLEFRVLDSYFCSGRREVEHIENDGFGAAVLAPMDSADDFNKSFAFMEGFLCSILANDG